MSGEHKRMQLNNLLQRSYGTHALTWATNQTGPQHSTPWTAVAYINGVEYGRGSGWTQGDAKEQAAGLAYPALYHQIYNRYP
ncbi:hypothetical protein NM688_g611 [Phlebia brevispora]|uniref:Uncharacterized protein n=1 Tax=Phlebia brevispora TaxID=194682 RepID=A0ACC1TE07_9APHY|nr:hypothetical protein NM688_g611 [Phlebia brevispora]